MEAGATHLAITAKIVPVSAPVIALPQAIQITVALTPGAADALQ
jgi:hypothetical protein